jgi:putative endonuclease
MDPRGTLATGGHAEDLARRFLEARGLRLVERNFRCRAGELDLVMTDAADLVLVEVRYRATPVPVSPVVSISPSKRRRLLRAGAVYLHSRRRFRGCAVRFDVVAMTGPLQAPAFEWIRGAFTADDTPGF